MTRPPYLVDDPPIQPFTPPPAASVSGWVRWLGLLCAAYVAGVHLGLCDQTYKEAPYLGASFAAGALVLIIGSSIAASGRRFGRIAPTTAWVVDAIVMVAALVVFVLSRTSGLPSYHHTDWLPVQVIAMGAEVAYVLLAAIALARVTHRS